MDFKVGQVVKCGSRGINAGIVIYRNFVYDCYKCKILILSSTDPNSRFCYVVIDEYLLSIPEPENYKNDIIYKLVTNYMFDFNTSIKRTYNNRFIFDDDCRYLSEICSILRYNKRKGLKSCIRIFMFRHKTTTVYKVQ